MIWLLDNGHGGMVGGEYVTPGKRSPQWPDMPQLFEGVFNRQVVKLIASDLKALSIQHSIIVPEQTDVSLSTRVTRVNAIYRQHSDAVLLSVHGNAGGGTGWECWTSKGDTKADRLVPYFFTQFGLVFPEMRMRADFTDGDADKEANFYILRHTLCPALLTENFFMDTESDCRLMLSRGGRIRIAKAHVDAILRIERIAAKGLVNA